MPCFSRLVHTNILLRICKALFLSKFLDAFCLNCLNFLILEKISICYFFHHLKSKKGADNSNTSLPSTPFIELLYPCQYVQSNCITQAQHIHVYLHLHLHTQFHMSTCIYYLLHTCIPAYLPCIYTSTCSQQSQH